MIFPMTEPDSTLVTPANDVLGQGGLPAVLRAGALAQLEDAAKALIIQNMQPLSLKAGQRLFRPSDSCANYLMVKSGSIKVMVTTESGREIVLYRVHDGETCVLTSACLLSGATYDAEGVAEIDTEAIILPRRAFAALLDTSPRFRQFVFSSYGIRLNHLIGLVQEIAVKQVDKRLARYLVATAINGVVAATHHAIAGELNTVREVVTRLLNEFATQGWVELSRGHILVRDGEALEQFASAV
jgi:CRP/FNR family transcriptional regulator, anaerobic regulatory protein